LRSVGHRGEHDPGQRADHLLHKSHKRRRRAGNVRKRLKRAGNRRYYRPADMAVLGQIKRLLRDEGYTIKGAQKALLSPGDIEVSEAEQSTPTLFDSVPETLENPTSETASRPLESLRTEQLRGLAMEAERLAAECAIVAAGNRPPTSMD